eukprot:gene12755-biopygen287
MITTTTATGMARTVAAQRRWPNPLGAIASSSCREGGGVCYDMQCRSILVGCGANALNFIFWVFVVGHCRLGHAESGQAQCIQNAILSNGGDDGRL